MKTKIGKIVFSCVCVVVGILAITILLLAIKVDCKSEQELESIDTFIASYDVPESTRIAQEESSEEIITETTEAEIKATETSESETETTVSVEELADIVINQGINGDEREAYLGDRYKEVQDWIDINYEPPYVEDYEPEPEVDYYYPSGDVLTPDAGINYYNGVLETYYNMDMSGVVDWMHDLGYEGDYWVRSDGVKMFGDYIMVAADYDWMPKGSIVETSLGTGIICDTGLGGWYWYDIAVDW